MIRQYAIGITHLLYTSRLGAKISPGRHGRQGIVCVCLCRRKGRRRGVEEITPAGQGHNTRWGGQALPSHGQRIKLAFALLTYPRLAFPRFWGGWACRRQPKSELGWLKLKLNVNDREVVEIHPTVAYLKI